MEETSILLTAAQDLVRQSWNHILSSQDRYRVVGECRPGKEAVALVRHTKPRILVIDTDGPEGEGSDLCRVVHEYSPATRVIIVSSHNQAPYACRMLQEGYSAFITKHSSLRELFAAIDAVRKGGVYICDEIKNKIAARVIHGDMVSVAFSHLTSREREIVRMVRKGQVSAQIAQQLSISCKTVEAHRHNILKKLKLKNTTALVNFASEHIF